MESRCDMRDKNLLEFFVFRKQKKKVKNENSIVSNASRNCFAVATVRCLNGLRISSINLHWAQTKLYIPISSLFVIRRSDRFVSNGMGCFFILFFLVFAQKETAIGLDARSMAHIK